MFLEGEFVESELAKLRDQFSKLTAECQEVQQSLIKAEKAAGVPVFDVTLLKAETSSSNGTPAPAPSSESKPAAAEKKEKAPKKEAAKKEKQPAKGKHLKLVITFGF